MTRIWALVFLLAALLRAQTSDKRLKSTGCSRRDGRVTAERPGRVLYGRGIGRAESDLAGGDAFFAERELAQPRMDLCASSRYICALARWDVLEGWPTVNERLLI